MTTFSTKSDDPTEASTLRVPATIVVPCYNEATRLDVAEFHRFSIVSPNIRFLLVNDCSTDRTSDVLSALTEIDRERFFKLDLARNGGKAAAVRAGVLQALDQRASVIGYWDADLATPLDAIPRFLRVLQQRPEIQLVCGARVRLLGREIERRPWRHVLGRIFATAASQVLGLPVYDTQCGAKLLRGNAETRAIFAEPFRADWVFDVELLARMIVHRQQAQLAHPLTAIYELPLQQWQDVAGSKVKAFDFIRAFGQLVDIARHYQPRRWLAQMADVSHAVSTHRIRPGTQPGLTPEPSRTEPASRGASVTEGDM